MKWVSVKESLPPCSERVLVLCNEPIQADHTIPINRMAEFVCGTQRWKMPLNDGILSSAFSNDGYITHWMKITKPEDNE